MFLSLFSQVDILLQRDDKDDLDTIIGFRNVLEDHLTPIVAALQGSQDILDGLNSVLGTLTVTAYVHDKPDREDMTHTYLDRLEIV